MTDAVQPGQSPEIAKLVSALSKVQGELRGYREDAENPYFKSRYGDLSSVWAAIRKPLSANGLAVVQTTLDSDGDGRIRLKTVLAHVSGEWISSVLSLKPTKDDPQAAGSAITYARRYSLAAIVGVAPEEDDAEASMDRQTEKEKAIEKIRKAKQKSAQRKADSQSETPAWIARLWRRADKAGITKEVWDQFRETHGIKKGAEIKDDNKTAFIKVVETAIENAKNPPKKMFASQEAIDALCQAAQGCGIATDERELVAFLKFRLDLPDDFNDVKTLTVDEVQAALEAVDKYGGTTDEG